jgi:hypothetical protein
MKRYALVTVVTVLGFIGFIQPANAGLIMSVTLNGSNFCVADNNAACGFGVPLIDTDIAVGRITLANQNIGGIDFVGSAQQATFGPTQNILNTSFLQATNNTGSTITGSVAVSATNFIPPVFNASISGAATFQNAVGSTSDLFWYNDPFNSQGAENPFDRPGTLLDSFSYNVTQIADSFAHSVNGIPILDINPFSMTLATDFSLVAGGQITNRGMTEIKPITAIPEPQSLALMGFGLMYLATRYRKFKK